MLMLFHLGEKRCQSLGIDPVFGWKEGAYVSVHYLCVVFSEYRYSTIGFSFVENLMCVRRVLSDTWLTEDQGGENVSPEWTLISLVLLWRLGIVLSLSCSKCMWPCDSS